MVNEVSFIQAVPVNRIFLQTDNPRFDPRLAIQTEKSAIEQLCSEEYILPIASDIVEHGLNPLELFALVPIQPEAGRADRTSYTVAEGNRRLCALKLLTDPELSPTSIKKEIAELSSKWEPIVSVSAAIFQKDDPQIRLWMMRIHDGLQGGRGRKQWNPEQKTRAWGGTKNKLALVFLDYAEEKGFISKEDRKNKLSVAERYLKNPLFREAIGLDKSDPDAFRRTRPEVEFDILVKKFIDDMKSGKVNTRDNSDAIVAYSRPFVAERGVTSARVPSEPLSTPAPAKAVSTKTNRSPKSPVSASFVGHELEIEDALKRLKNEKLERLYYSITQVELKKHTLLVCVGVWPFFESLTACAGRRSGTSFVDFFSNQKLSQYGLGTGKDLTPIRAIIERLSEHGNTTKHHQIAATFNGDQLNNDITALKSVILKCVEEAIAASP